MEIIFAGICCWVDALPPGTGKTVIIRNALGGGSLGSLRIPPHHAFIHAKRNQVDTTDWPSEWTGSEDNLLFYLGGDYVTFDPAPSGGSIDLSLVPHVFDSVDDDPICPDAEEIRPGYLVGPRPEKVLALVDIPANADVDSDTNANEAVYVTMRMAEAPVRIIATPFTGGEPRSLTITDPDAQVFIANVTLSDYLAGEGAPDDSHRHLFCEIFKPSSDRAVRETNASRLAAQQENACVGAFELNHVSVSMLRRAAQRNMSTFLDTLAAGCSDSQWP